MATDPPTPQTCCARLAEDPQVIHPWVAAPVPIEACLEALNVVEHVLQAHDRRDRDVCGGGQSGRDQPHGGSLLCGSLLMDGEATMISRGVEPATALIVGRVVCGNGSLANRALLRVERVQPRTRRLGHPVRYLATGAYFIADHAHIGHARNLTRSPAPGNHSVAVPDYQMPDLDGLCRWRRSSRALLVPSCRSPSSELSGTRGCCWSRSCVSPGMPHE